MFEFLDHTYDRSINFNPLQRQNYKISFLHRLLVKKIKIPIEK